MNNKPYMIALLLIKEVGKQVEHIDAVFTTLAKMSDSVPKLQITKERYLKIHITILSTRRDRRSFYGPRI